MSYLAITTIDLENADSEDYECINKEFKKIGLNDQLKADNGNDVELPHNTYAGSFNGTNEKTVRDNLLKKIKAALKICNVRGQIFLAVHGYWIKDSV